MENQNVTLGMESVISELDATVHMNTNCDVRFFEFRYMFKGDEYCIEVPKTDANSFLNDGDKVVVLLGMVKVDDIPTINVEKE